MCLNKWFQRCIRKLLSINYVWRNIRVWHLHALTSTQQNHTKCDESGAPFLHKKYYTAEERKLSFRLVFVLQMITNPTDGIAAWQVKWRKMAGRKQEISLKMKNEWWTSDSDFGLENIRIFMCTYLLRMYAF